MNGRRPVVTGLGCLCAAGPTLEKAWAGMLAGVSAAAPPTRFSAETRRRSPVFEVADGAWTASAIGPGRCGERTRTVEFFLAALDEALGQAGLTADGLRGRRVAVAVGTTVGCTLNDERFYREFRNGDEPGMGAIRRFLANNPAPFVSEALDLRGPVSTINNACSSGADAVGQAVEWIADDWCDIVIAGGADELSRIPYVGFASLMNTSEQPSRPFDINRDGLNLGEGAGVLIIEHPDSAGRRGAAILAEVTGYGCAMDAFHITAPHPEGLGLEQAVRRSLAGIDPREISFVNAHATATVPNDKIEGRTLARIFGPEVPVVGTKPYTGHTLGAAGALEAVFTIQGLLSGRIPATLGFRDPDPECAVIPTRGVTEILPMHAVSTSLAFGGNNSALVFRAGK
jgi:3-oxoacyl-(acyl-carrier-protein) synthase